MEQSSGKVIFGQLGRILAPGLLILGGTLMGLLLIEGAHALYRFDRPHRSAIYVLYDFSIQKFRAAPASENSALSSNLLTQRQTIEHLLPQMQAAGIGLGNTDFIDLQNENASLNYWVDGCRAIKPNVHKSMRHLRSTLFNPLDPINLFHDTDVELPKQLNDFIDRYGLRQVSYSSNDVGYRTTLPIVSARTKVLIAGDSVANGLMVDDSETLASRLQSRDQDRQYVNIAVSGANASDIKCALERAANHFKGDVREIIYVYCENDILEPSGKPEEIVVWLKRFAKENTIERIVMIYAPYIYNVVPNILGRTELSFAAEREALLSLSKKAGFSVIDIGDVALAEAERRGTQFAALSVFVDHVHLSPYGTDILAKRIVDSTF